MYRYQYVDGEIIEHITFKSYRLDNKYAYGITQMVERTVRRFIHTELRS